MEPNEENILESNSDSSITDDGEDEELTSSIDEEETTKKVDTNQLSVAEAHQRWIVQLKITMLTKEKSNRVEPLREWLKNMRHKCEINYGLITGQDIRNHMETRVLESLVLMSDGHINAKEDDPITFLDQLDAIVNEEKREKSIEEKLDLLIDDLCRSIKTTNRDRMVWVGFHMEVKDAQLNHKGPYPPKDGEIIRHIGKSLKNEDGLPGIVIKRLEGQSGKTLIEWQHESFDDFWRAVLKVVNDWISAERFVADVDRDRKPKMDKSSHQLNDENRKDRQHPDKKRKLNPLEPKFLKDAENQKKKKITKLKTPPCTICGRLHLGECNISNHPQANRDNVPWTESKMGKLMKTMRMDVLPYNKQLLNGKLVPWSKTKCKLLVRDSLRSDYDDEYINEAKIESGDDCEGPGVSGKSHFGLHSENRVDLHALACRDGTHDHLLSLKGLIGPEDGTIRAELMLPNRKSIKDDERECVVLMDTGANSYNFCNHRMRDLSMKYGVVVRNCEHEIQTGPTITKVCQKIVLSLRFYNLNKVDFYDIALECLILPMIHDVVIGRQTIQTHSVLRQTMCCDYLKVDDLDAIHRILLNEDDDDNDDGEMRDPGSTLSRRDGMTRNPNTSEHDQQSGVTIPYLATMYSKSCDDEAPAVVEGDEDFRNTQLQLCKEFADCFSSKLRPEAALIPPMKLRVSDVWDCKENKRSPRPQGRVRQLAIDEQVTDMERHGVIRLSSADNHSQIHLTPKPDGSWRFCVDYRRLNAATVGQNWPIPNIKEMLQRIGEKRPTVFGVLDLTKGYYQAPLSEGSRKYTAFITAKHLWEWCRVPMGLMGAPAYFQKMMTTVVLNGIIRNGCECYMDDIIVYGHTQDEYLRNLKRVLQQLRKYRLTASPKKTKLGLQSIEYVGHVIDHEGITFDRKRLQKIIEFELPETKKELKSFLGLVTYVRDNCKDTSKHTKLLTEMISGYTTKSKNQRLVWTDRSKEAFNRVQEMVNDAQKLFFIRDDATNIHLYTDASQYGIGASLIQVVEGKDQVISLMSRTLNGTQCKWSTIEKECFAIVEALRKFEYLIRDVHFTLHTDHANLVHIHDTGSPKVMAWKMLIQECDFDCIFIEGEANKTADLLSRNKTGEVLEEEPENYIVTDLAKLTLENPKMTPEQVTVPMLMALQCIDSQVRPTEEQYTQMKSVHNSVVGHNGVETTLKRLKDRGYMWKYMRQMVTKFIRQCDICQKNDARRREVHVQPFVTLTGTGLMKERSVDFIGPMEEDDDGHKYICVVIDQFSRWVELYRTKTNDAMAAARALLDHFGRFGIPNRIRTDRGREFRNELIEYFLKIVGCEHILSTADSHEENGIVEAANAEVRRYLNDFLYDRQFGKKGWSDNLAIAQRIINSMDKTLTGMTPAYVLFGGALDLQDGLIPMASGDNNIAPEMENTSWGKWLEDRRVATERAIEIIRRRLNEHEECQKGRDNGLRTEFAVGSLVLKEYRPSAMGRKPNKQVLYRTGPYEVMSHQDQTYTLKDPVTGKLLPPCNVHLLREYEYDPVHTDPQQVRSKDMEDVFLIEEVIRHVGKWSNLNNMKFIVKWVGYDDEYEETWANLKNNSEMHRYLEERNLHKYIPRRFRKTK